jgi:hypothetical protein
MNRALEKLVNAANRASQKTRFGCYPMAPSVGITEREIARHRPAMEACAIAAKALKEAGDPRASEYERAREDHSWVVHRRGAF